MTSPATSPATSKAASKATPKSSPGVTQAATTTTARQLFFVARLLLFLGGIALAVWLLRSVGFASVGAILRRGWYFVPIVALLEIVFVAADVIAVRGLLGASASKMSRRVWIRSTTLAYAATILLPAGRAAGEATRTAVFAPAIGTAKAAGTCTRLQACVLVGNTVVSAVILVAIVSGMKGAQLLVAPLVINTLGCAALATAIFAALGSGRLGAFLARHLPKFAKSHASTDASRPSKADLARASLILVAGRLFQTLQYAVALYAVGGALTVTRAFATQGAHLVGAAAGDLVPGQAGVAEGAYRVFASALSLDPAGALAIAIMARIAQISLSLACLLVAGALSFGKAPQKDAP